MQEVCEAVWRLKPAIRDAGHLAAYLRTSVVNRGPGPAVLGPAQRGEIADTLNTSTETVKSTAHGALAALRARLKGKQ